MSRYVVSFETVVEVVNVDGEFTDSEIEDVLRRDLQREIEQNGTDDERTSIHATANRPDYGLRLVRAVNGFIDTQHPDDPLPDGLGRA